jgi:hypothetical protein
MLSTVISLLIIPFLGQGDSFVASPKAETLAVREFSLGNRHADKYVNGVFKDNILLTLKYLSGEKIDPGSINFEDVRRPFNYKLIVKPGETFAFHDDVLPEFEGKISATTNAHFNAQGGFRFSGLLFGDGVCHLASLLYWTARDAGLDARSAVNHDFANIPDIPREYGVSIYAYPGKQYSDQMQNLYITNNKDRQIMLEFTYDGQNLKITASKSIN